jgi:hypothetical protein
MRSISLDRGTDKRRTGGTREAGRKIARIDVMPHGEDRDEIKAKDARWPYVFLFLFMLGGIFGTATNTDPVKLDYSISVVFGIIAAAGAVIYFAIGRIKGHALFGFGNRPIFQNIAWHIFILTGIIFLSFLFFISIVAIMVLTVHAPMFEASCGVPSQRDVALFVWDAMANGAFKFLAKYLDLAQPSCAPNQGSSVTYTMDLSIKFFTSLVLVWYAISLAKAWYGRLRSRVS